MVSDVADLAIMGVKGLGYAIEGDMEALALTMILGILPFAPSISVRLAREANAAMRHIGHQIGDFGQQLFQDANGLIRRLDNSLNNTLNDVEDALFGSRYDNYLVTPDGVVINGSNSQWLDDNVVHFNGDINGWHLTPSENLNVGSSGLPNGINVSSLALGPDHCKDFIREIAPVLKREGFTFRIYQAHPTNTPLLIDGRNIADVKAPHYFIEYNGFVFDNFNWSNPRTLDDYLGQLGSQTQVTFFEVTPNTDLDKFISDI